MNPTKVWFAIFPLKIGDVVEVGIRRYKDAPLVKVDMLIIDFTKDQLYPYRGRVLTKGEYHKRNFMFSFQHIERKVGRIENYNC